MKKFILSVVALLGLVFTTNAQMVVDAEMFKANPTAFMGKVVTIKNVTLTSSNCHTPKVSGVVTAPVGGAGAGSPTSPAPVGVAGKNAYCNPAPNLTLTKWSFGPNNSQCLQADARVLPMLPAAGAVAKEVSFRVTPTMFLITRVVK